MKRKTLAAMRAGRNGRRIGMQATGRFDPIARNRENMHMALSRLPINLDDLLAHRGVETDRIEYKAGWNPDPIIRTLCAFANDFENLGGGYIVIGLEIGRAHV